MPNKNYVKGVRKERKLVNGAREQGLIAFRSAGSHSPIDVCIIDATFETKKIRFIQCKPDTMSDKKKWEIKERMKDLQGLFIVSFEVL